MSDQTISASFSDAEGNRVRVDVPATHVTEHLAIHRTCARQSDGTIVTGSGWVVAHLQTGFNCTGGNPIPRKEVALKYAHKFAALPMDWNTDSVDEVRSRALPCMESIRAYKAEIRAMQVQS